MTTQDYRQIVPLKWYKFIIYFQLFAGGVINIISAFNYLSGNSYGINTEKIYSVYQGLDLLDKIWGFLSVIMGVYCFKVRQDLAKFKTNGPKNYLNILRINCYGSLIYKLLVLITLYSYWDPTTRASSLLSYVISFAIGLIFISLNKTYFGKRQFLFTEETNPGINKSESKEYDTFKYVEVNESTTGTTPDAREVKIFCPNCNKDLTNDVAANKNLMFCPYCDCPRYSNSNLAEEPHQTEDTYLAEETHKQADEITIQSDEWTCINCGEANPLTAKFCKGCGTWKGTINQPVIGDEQISHNEQAKEDEHISHTEEEIIQSEHKTKYCFKCGFELKGDAKFCIMCGERQPEIK